MNCFLTKSRMPMTEPPWIEKTIRRGLRLFGVHPEGTGPDGSQGCDPEQNLMGDGGNHMEPLRERQERSQDGTAEHLSGDEEREEFARRGSALAEAGGLRIYAGASRRRGAICPVWPRATR